MTVGLTPEAVEQYGKLPRGIQPRVNTVILRLAQWPKVSGVKPLVGRLGGTSESEPATIASCSASRATR